MSSVSGGGYAAASVQWWWRQDRNSDAGGKFPYGVKAASCTDEEDKKLAFLRWHANFLAPGGGISIWSGVAVVLRTIILSLLVWLPVAVALMALIEAVPALVVGGWGNWHNFTEAGCANLGLKSQFARELIGLKVSLPLFVVAALCLIALIAGIFLLASLLLMLTSIIVPPETNDNRDARVRRATRIAIWFILGSILGAFSITSLNSWIQSGQFLPPNPTDVTNVFISAALVFFGLVAAGLALLQRLRRNQLGINYWFRRIFEKYATLGFALLLGLAILASLPFVAARH